LLHHLIKKINGKLISIIGWKCYDVLSYWF